MGLINFIGRFFQEPEPTPEPEAPEMDREECHLEWGSWTCSTCGQTQGFDEGTKCLACGEFR